MKLDRKADCPLFKEPCRQLKCEWFMSVRGAHPQTGEPIDDEWDCAIKWLVLTSIGNIAAARGNQAATESMRNEIVERMDNPPHHVPGQLDLIDRIASTPLLTNGDHHNG
jgi:hypothetical protein